MVLKNVKKNWTTPKVERIKLEFDKEMGALCYSSGTTPSNDFNCGLDPEAAHNCWNKKS